MTTATRPHLSHSQISRFTLCPRSWHYGYVLEAERERVGSALIFGIAVHDAAAAVNEAALQGTTANAQDLFTARWEEEKALGLEIHFGRDDEQALLDKGRALLDIYRAPAGIIGVEQAFTLELSPDLPEITGRIDLILEKKGKLWLADLKTSGTTKVSDTTGLEAQLALYDLAYPADGFQAIVLAKTKTAQVTYQPVTPWPKPQLVQHYQEVYRAMQSGVRYAVRGWQCESCSFRDRCRRDCRGGT